MCRRFTNAERTEPSPKEKLKDLDSAFSTYCRSVNREAMPCAAKAITGTGPTIALARRMDVRILRRPLVAVNAEPGARKWWSAIQDGAHEPGARDVHLTVEVAA